MKASLFAALAAASKYAGANKLDIHPPHQPSIADQLSMASSVRVKKNFLSKSEMYLYRHNENKYEHMPAVGLSGDKTFGGAHISRSFMRRLVEEGAEQCPSDDYEETLPSGVNIRTMRFKKTTHAHIDVNRDFKRIKNDVGVVFLNTNEDAAFVVGDKAIPVEEGTLVMFPGGSVFHHTEMKKEGGFVHMLGPFEVGGSHGRVADLTCMNGALSSLVGSGESKVGKASYFKRRRQLEGEGGTNPDTKTRREPSLGKC